MGLDRVGTDRYIDRTQFICDRQNHLHGFDDVIVNYSAEGEKHKTF